MYTCPRSFIKGHKIRLPATGRLLTSYLFCSDVHPTIYVLQIMHLPVGINTCDVLVSLHQGKSSQGSYRIELPDKMCVLSELSSSRNFLLILSMRRYNEPRMAPLISPCLVSY